MKKAILINAKILSMAILCSCNGQAETTKSDVENLNLVGKIKTVTTVHYDIYDKFGEGILQKAKPLYANIQIYSFDSLGNILSDKNLVVTDAKKTYTTVFNKSHQKSKWLCYSDDDDTKIEYGHYYYYDDKGNIIKETDLVENKSATYYYTFDNQGNITSQTGGLLKQKRFWQYKDGSLTQFTEYFSDMKTVHYYKDGLLYKDVRSPEIYWTYTYDEQKRRIESTMFINDNIFKKQKNIYLSNIGNAPTETIIWNSDGDIAYDYYYEYFIVGNDTMTILKYDKDKLSEIEFYSKDMDGNTTKDSYNVESNLLGGYLYYYNDSNLISRKDLIEGTCHKYVNDIATVIEEDEVITEKKYKRNVLISKTTKNKSGEIQSSYMVDTDDRKRITTIINNGVTNKIEETLGNGKLVKSYNTENNLTNTYSYMEAGYVSEIECSDGTKYSYKYELDAQGNWVQKTEYKNGKPNKIWERSIIYY